MNLGVGVGLYPGIQPQVVRPSDFEMLAANPRRTLHGLSVLVYGNSEKDVLG